MLQKRRVSKRKHNAVPSAVSWGEAALMFALTHATLRQHLAAGNRTEKGMRMASLKRPFCAQAPRHRGITSRSRGLRNVAGAFPVTLPAAAP